LRGEHPVVIRVKADALQTKYIGQKQFCGKPRAVYTFCLKVIPGRIKKAKYGPATPAQKSLLKLMQK